MKITNECNMELMARYEDNYFDLAIVDPPYGIGDWTAKYKNDKKRNTKKKWAVNWNDDTPDDNFFKELIRVSKEQIIWGANYYNCFSKKGGAIIWNKGVIEESNLSMCEIASYSKFKKVTSVDIKWQNLNRCEITIHPCQKPIKLYEWLLMNYAKEGDKILDTHLGSGSIAIACHNLGFDLTACELDKDYYNAAMKRLKQHQAQLRLI